MFVTAERSRFDVDAVIFDKDGTLIDLLASWSPAGRAWINVTAGDDAGLAAMIGEAIGVREGVVVADGLLAAGTMGQLEESTRLILDLHGIADTDERIGRARTLASRITNEHLTPIGDVSGTLRRMSKVGLGIGVVTSDDRAATLEALDRLDVSDFIGVVVAGNDGFAPKPSPEPLWRAADALGVPIERVLYVGDSNVDRKAAISAPTAGFVLVGVRDPSQEPRPGVDATIISIDELGNE